MSEVIARKYRPQTFEQIIGQPQVTKGLENRLRQKRIHHAYIFSGSRGTGKTTTARVFARSLNCESGPIVNPCGTCPSCLEIARGGSLDVLEIDAGSNTGVDNIRDVIIDVVNIYPARDRYKIYIIDEAHELSKAAFNALLKTLEEPPEYVILMLATTELLKFPKTVRSRCQVLEFRSIPAGKIYKQLKYIAEDKQVKIGDVPLFKIARFGDGSLRDAQTAFDQVISFSGDEITEEDVNFALGLVSIELIEKLIKAIYAEDSAAVLSLIEEVALSGVDLTRFVMDFMAYVRAMLVIKSVGFNQFIVQMTKSEGASCEELSELFSEQDLIRFFSILTKTEKDVKVSRQPRFHVEICMMKILQAKRLYLLEECLERVKSATEKLQ